MERQAVEVASSGAEPDQAKSTDRLWRRFALAYLGVFAGVIGAGYAFIILVDPYDSGRFPSLGLPGQFDRLQRGNSEAGGPPRELSIEAKENTLTVKGEKVTKTAEKKVEVLYQGIAARAFERIFRLDTDTPQRTDNVALGRSARFNAAIFGNSHGQLLSPRRLSQATGLDFVQLTVPGANVREQLATMHWFMRHHPRPGALVLALDERWCVTDPALPLRSPFPFWLYSDSNLVYLANVLSIRSLRYGLRRLASAGGPASIDGYSDYEVGRTWSFKPGEWAPAEGFPARDDRPFRREPDFPGLILLDALLGEIPASTPIVIVLPPQFYTELPQAGTGGARFRDYCKWQIALRAQRGAGSAFLDFLVDSAITRNPENFMDPGHHHGNVAEMIEAEIATALNGRRAAARARPAPQR
jgi:hypothetical protein